MRERFGAAGAWGQCAPAALIRRGRPAPQLHRWATEVKLRVGWKLVRVFAMELPTGAIPRR
jgi:hypothetical protein